MPLCTKQNYFAVWFLKARIISSKNHIYWIFNKLFRIIRCIQCGVKNNVDLIYLKNTYIFTCKKSYAEREFYREFFMSYVILKLRTCDFYLVMKMIISPLTFLRATIPFLERYDVRLRMGLNYPIIPQTRFSGRRDKTATPREKRASLARLDLGRAGV